MGTGRSDKHPALASTQVCVFDQFEAKNMRVEGDGFLIVANDQCDVTHRLRHRSPL